MKTASSHFLETPHTKPGWWSFWLMIAFVVMFLINSFMFMPSSSDAPWRHIILPFYGIFMMLCGLSAGIASLLAIIRRHEHSWLVWLPLLPGLFVVFFLLGEFLFPH